MDRLLLPQDLLLLIYDDDSGKSLVNSTVQPVAVGGAALLDLVLAGSMLISEESGMLGTKRVLRATDGPRPTDPLLVKVMEKAEGKKMSDAVGEISGITSFSNLSKDLTKSLLYDMAGGGLLRAERHGVFGQERFPASDGRYEAELRAQLQAVLQGTVAPDPRSIGLLSILRSTDVLAKVFPEWDKRELKQRVKTLSEGDWAGKAVKDALDELLALFMTILGPAAGVTMFNA